MLLLSNVFVLLQSMKFPYSFLMKATIMSVIVVCLYKRI